MTLIEIERPYHSPRDAISASMPVLINLLKENNVTYEEFVFAL